MRVYCILKIHKKTVITIYYYYYLRLEVVPDEKYKKWNSTIGSGNKFARRARSFKEDLLDIISAMRSPSHSAISSRSGSPKNGLPKQRHASSGSSPKRSLNDIDFNVRQVSFNFTCISINLI